MEAPPSADTLAEPLRNELLRRVDWRFLLQGEERPRVLDLTSGRISQALRLVSAPAADRPGSADVVVLGYPRRRDLATARRALRGGGELVCLWDLPLPGSARLARRALRRAGFPDVRLYWPGPLRRHSPQFWLPLGSAAAAVHLLAQRPPRTRAQALLRPIWRLARRLGALAPVWVLARAPGGEAAGGPVDDLPGMASGLLLTGGERSINKVVGLPFDGGAGEPQTVLKFARIPEGDAALDREATALRVLEAERPAVPGVPRIVADGRRCGRRGLAQTAIYGQPLLSKLSPATFAGLAAKVTDWLVDLADSPQPQPPELWWARLAGEPLADLERDFGAVLEAGASERASELLEGLGALPQVCEHRDCAPWNVVLTAGGTPALLDWESAEPRGLPGLDLVYFLANCAFKIESAYEPGRARASYSRLLDPLTPFGKVAADCIGAYRTRLGLSEDALRRLRLLCWIVHCRSDYRHLEMDAAGPPSPEALRRSIFLALVEAELRDPRIA
jgi:Phosphotransferase enzyme family